MVKQTDYIDVKEFDELEYCSLVKATRMIAFNERPIEDSISELVYPNYDGTLAHFFFEGENKGRFEAACKILQVVLIQGKISARGFAYNADNDFALMGETMHDIPQDAWSQVDNSDELFVYNPMSISSICKYSKITYLPKEKLQPKTLYCEIEVKTKDLKRVLPLGSGLISII